MTEGNKESMHVVCQQCRIDFMIDAVDRAFYERMKVPSPTLCPDCRLKRRFAWRNERTFFKRKDSGSGKIIFSGFPEQAPFPVYDTTHWWSDTWDAIDYGRDFDPARPFFEQVRDLMRVVPQPSRSVYKIVNSDYSDQASNLKNGYMCFNIDQCEDCAYLIRGVGSRTTDDCLHVQGSELVYDSVLLEKCFRCFYSIDCESSTGLWFSNDCVGCTDCFGCVGLRKKSYQIWNEQYSREEYFKKLETFNLGSRAAIQKIKEEARRFWERFPVRYYHGIRNIGSSGDMISDTKNVRQSWWMGQAQDIRYSQGVYLTAADSYDFTVGWAGTNRVYESVSCGEQVSDLKFCFDCWPASKNLEYCMTCRSSSECFGCIGLRKKQYCILNKHYTKDEYYALRKAIIGQMDALPYVSKNTATGGEIVYRYGEFFPVEFSPFAYNDTMLQDAFPLKADEACKKGYVWRDIPASEYKITLRGDALPDASEAVSDAVIREIIECVVCARAYRIIPMELAFYQKIRAPLPDRCPNCRHAERFALVNPPRFNERQCSCAGAKDESGRYVNAVVHAHGNEHCTTRFETAYSADVARSVYCEKCYNTEII